ncbi:unnamed protein product [Urochloa humidicola]
MPPAQFDHQAHLDLNAAGVPSSPSHRAAAATARPPTRPALPVRSPMVLQLHHQAAHQCPPFRRHPYPRNLLS